MLTDEQVEQIMELLPILRESSEAMLREFREAAYFARIPSGRDIFVQYDEVGAIPLVIAGTVRVYKVGDTGRELTLYRFGRGESCIMTTNAVLNHETFSAIATAEDAIEAIMIPADKFRAWVGHYESWRLFVFDLLSQRLSRVMEVVEEVTFGRLDIRVSNYLLERSRTENPIHVTHQDIAAELGSSREVITRILQSFAEEEAIRLSRGMIEVVDEDRLSNRALM